MTNEIYTVKINRREGIVEIAGPDKDWIAAQLDRLAVVYEQEPADAPGPDALGSDSEAGEGANAGSGADSKPARKRRSGGRGSARAKPSDLEEKLTKDVMRQMHGYFDDRPKATKNHQNRAAVVATFLSEELGVDGMGAHDLLAVYRAMGWSPPKNPNAVIRNAVDRNGYFGGMRDGKVHLTPTGEHFGRHGSKEADGDE